MRVGLGTDLHALKSGEGIYLGGIFIPCDYEAVADSDGDVVFHAIIDAILGASALGDIGTYFTSSSITYNERSSNFVAKVLAMLEEKKYKIHNLDIVIELEKPSLRSYKERIRENIANTLKITINQVNIKAKTGQKLGIIGESKAISAQCVVLLNV